MQFLTYSFLSHLQSDPISQLNREGNLNAIKLERKFTDAVFGASTSCSEEPAQEMSEDFPPI